MKVRPKHACGDEWPLQWVPPKTSGRAPAAAQAPGRWGGGAANNGMAALLPGCTVCCSQTHQGRFREASEDVVLSRHWTPYSCLVSTLPPLRTVSITI